MWVKVPWTEMLVLLGLAYSVLTSRVPPVRPAMFLERLMPRCRCCLQSQWASPSLEAPSRGFHVVWDSGRWKELCMRVCVYAFILIFLNWRGFIIIILVVVVIIILDNINPQCGSWGLHFYLRVLVPCCFIPFWLPVACWSTWGAVGVTGVFIELVNARPEGRAWTKEWKEEGGWIACH